MSSNTNISSLNEVISPIELQMKYPMTQDDIDFVCDSRKQIEQILLRKDPRLLVVVGPCSIHDYDTAIQYAKILAEMIKQRKNLYIVMRVYFEKPRTRTGWKGFIYDPDLNERYDTQKGLALSRKLLLELVQMRIPVGCEFLDLITPQYISDLVSWGAIGARTSESQTHRQLASGLSMPIGFKNLTSGDTNKAINGIISAQVPHNFIGISEYGKVSQIITKGNQYAHLILRGGDEPNYKQDIINLVAKDLKKENIDTGIIIDCSHGNSQSNYNRQISVAIYAKRLQALNRYPIAGIMLESNILKGNQKLNTDAPQNLIKGKSITDACIDISTTNTLLELLDTIQPVNINSLGEIRMLIREYDQLIYTFLSEKTHDTKIKMKNIIVLTKYIFERDKIVEELCRANASAEYLSMLVTLRFGFSEKVAELKFSGSPFNFLNRSNDFLKLITDREIEKTNLRLFNNPIYLKIMDVSKLIQVDYLEAFTKTVKIGYLFGKGTFSAEAVTKFRGVHLSYPSIQSLTVALNTKEVDYILIPTYNSLIGEIFQAESYWEPLGSIDQNIDLCLFSNVETPLLKEATIYLEPHIQLETATFLEKHALTNIKPVSSSKEGCISCIKDQNPALTISSKNNMSNFLYTLNTDVVEHNITTFTLYGL